MSNKVFLTAVAASVGYYVGSNTDSYEERILREKQTYEERILREKQTCEERISREKQICTARIKAAEEKRYPINLEYSIIHNCAKGQQHYFSSIEYNQNLKSCICALTNTTKEIPYTAYEKDRQNKGALFTNSFNKNLKRCKTK